MFISSFLDDFLDPPDLLENEPKAKEMAYKRDVPYMLKPAFGTLRAIPSAKRPSVITGLPPVASKPRTGEKRLIF